MAKKQILGFQPARRLEQVDDEHPKRVQDCEHRQGSCDDSASRRESQAGWNFRTGQQSLTPTSAGFGNRVLVGDLLHNSARNGSTIDRFCKTAVIDRLLLPFAEQLRRVSNRILYQFDVERHEDASRHGEALERIESSGQHCLVRERALKALIDQPKLEAAKQVLDD